MKKAASKRMPFELPTGVTLPLYCSEGERVVDVMVFSKCNYMSAYIVAGFLTYVTLVDLLKRKRTCSAQAANRLRQSATSTIAR